MRLKVTTFGGEIPRVNKRLLPDTQAQSAINCDLVSGSLKAVCDDVAATITPYVTLPDGTKSIYNYNWEKPDELAYNWLPWTTDVNVAKSPIVSDLYNRIYYMGDGAPKIRYVPVRESSKVYLGGSVVRWGGTSNQAATLWKASYVTGGSYVDCGGRTAATAPDISAKGIGQTVVDGSITWTRLPESSVLEWSANTDYVKDEVVKHTIIGGFTYWVAQNDGKSGSDATVFDGKDIGNSVTDNTITWVQTFYLTSPEFAKDLGIPKPVGVITATATNKSATSWTATWDSWWEEKDGTKKGERTFPGTGESVSITTPGSVYTLNYVNTDTSHTANAVLTFRMQASSNTGAILGRVYPSTSYYVSSSDLYINGAKISVTQSTTGTSPNFTTVYTLAYDTSAASEYVSDRAYVYTFVSELGEEGPPSTPSTTIAVGPNQDAILTGMDETVSGSYVPIVRKRIYRTVTSTTGTSYHLVKEIDIAPMPYQAAVFGGNSRYYYIGEVATWGGIWYEALTNNINEKFSDTSVWLPITTNWISGTTYKVGDVVSHNGFFQRKVAGAGTTEPDHDTTNWSSITTAAQFEDNITDAEVGEVIPSITWTPPGVNYTGLVYLPGGFFAAFENKTVYFSEINYPHAWPTEYGVSIDDKIVGLGVSQNTLAVLTDRYPYLITAQAPDQTSVSKLAAPQACVAKRSIVESGGAIIYASQDGIAVITDATIVISTLGMLSKDIWTEYRQNTAITDKFVIDDSLTQCFVNDQYVWVNTKNKTFRFRIGDNTIAIVEAGSHFYGYFDDRKNDDLYVITGNDTNRYLKVLQDSSTNFLEATWWSKEISVSVPVKFTLARITATAYPIYLTVYSGEPATEVISNYKVENNKAFRLPLLRREKFWSMKLKIPSATGTAPNEVTEFILTTNYGEL